MVRAAWDPNPNRQIRSRSTTVYAVSASGVLAGRVRYAVQLMRPSHVVLRLAE
jgi:hypothetical protein